MALTADSRQVSVFSTNLLASVWIVAVISIPSASSYQDQLSSGTPAEKITTLHDSLSIIIVMSSIASWVLTSAWLMRRHREISQHATSPLRLKASWARWGWVVPVVQLWFPKMMIDDLLKNTSQKNEPISTNIWWYTWLGFSFLSNYAQVRDIIEHKSIGIHPEYEIAAACVLTASYLVWTKIVRAIGS